jgi:hypothetical protein
MASDEDAPNGPEPPPSLAALVEKLRKGEPVDPAEVRRLRSELSARARENQVLIGKLGGMDAKAAKTAAKKLEREVRALGLEGNRGEEETG